MPENDKKLSINLGINTLLTGLCTVVGAVVGMLSWANHQQLDTISLKQDKAILQVQSDAADKFVTKQWFQAEDAILKSQIATTSEAVQKVATAVGDLKIDSAVIKAELQKQNNPQINIKN